MTPYLAIAIATVVGLAGIRIAFRGNGALGAAFYALAFLIAVLTCIGSKLV